MLARVTVDALTAHGRAGSANHCARRSRDLRPTSPLHRGSSRLHRSLALGALPLEIVITAGVERHLSAFEVEDIYQLCADLQASGITINRPPRDGYMAFIRSPDGISIELLQKGGAKEAAEPWMSMENTGNW